MKYRYLIIDEDGTPRGTNNQQCADMFATTNCAQLVVDLEKMSMRFENQYLGEVKEQEFNPDDWK